MPTSARPLAWTLERSQADPARLRLGSATGEPPCVSSGGMHCHFTRGPALVGVALRQDRGRARRSLHDPAAVGRSDHRAHQGDRAARLRCERARGLGQETGRHRTAASPLERTRRGRSCREGDARACTCACARRRPRCCRTAGERPGPPIRPKICGYLALLAVTLRGQPTCCRGGASHCAARIDHAWGVAEAQASLADAGACNGAIRARGRNCSTKCLRITLEHGGPVGIAQCAERRIGRVRGDAGSSRRRGRACWVPRAAMRDASAAGNARRRMPAMTRCSPECGPRCTRVRIRRSLCDSLGRRPFPRQAGEGGR